jgi:TFIIF-interacting CTD phosphatase-like protein
VLKVIDPEKKFIKAHFTRMHASPTLTAMVKDLSRLGRPLEKMVIVDNSPENYQLQPHNGIFISTWLGDRSDHALRDLGTLLVSMAKE